MQYVSQLFLTSVIFLSFVHPIYADSMFGDWNVFQDIRKVLQTSFEAIIIDPNEKQRIVVNNMAYWQQEKENIVKQGRQVPPQLEETISSKQESLSNIDTASSSALSMIVDSIRAGQELGKIRDYVSIFHDLRENKGMQSEEKIRELESNVNNLNLVKKHCNYISVNNLLSVPNPYESLKNSCKILETVPRGIVESTLHG